jgi:hypothetical protein
MHGFVDVAEPILKVLKLIRGKLTVQFT